MMDTLGNKKARVEKRLLHAPNVAFRVVDRAIQAHDAAGVSEDFPLAASWAGIRTLRLADGPDEFYRNMIAKLELKK